MPINPLPMPKKKYSSADIALVVGILVLVGIGIWMIVRENMNASRPADLPNSFVYDISDLKKVDPALITFEETQQIESGLDSVLGMCVFQDEVYVAGDGGLKVFKGDGDFSKTLVQRKKVSSVYVHSHDAIYTGQGNQIVVYDREGTRGKEWPAFNVKCNLRSITANERYVFIADSVNRVIYVTDHDGVVQRKIGENNDSGLVVPGPHLDLQWNEKAQLLYVANPGRHRIDGYTEDGELTTFWGKASMKIEGFCGCCNPTAFAQLPSGEFITSEKGLNRVKRHTTDGVLLDVVAAPNIFAKQAKIFDIETDELGNVYVLDNERKQIRVFRPKS